MIKWKSTLGGSSVERGYALDATHDGGVIVVGETNSNDGDVSGNHGAVDIWVVKLDSAGQLDWQRCLGGTDYEEGNGVKSTADGGYVVVGSSRSDDGDVANNQGQEDYWIVKLSSTGSILWETTVGGYVEDVGRAVDEMADGGIIVAGYSESTNGDVTGNNGVRDFWITKFDSLGVLQWQKALGGSINEWAHSIKATADKGCVVLGTTGSSNGDITNPLGNYDFWMVKLDSLGSLEWQKTFGGAENDEAYSLDLTYDQGFIVAGRSQSSNGHVSANQGGYDMWVLKLDSSGTIQWERSLGGSQWDQALSVIQTNDGGFGVLGITQSNDGDVSGNHGGSDFWMVKLDFSGTMLWQKCIGGTGADGGFGLSQSHTGDYFITGETFSTDGDMSSTNQFGSMWVAALTEDYAVMTGRAFADLNSNDQQDAGELGFANHMIQRLNDGSLFFTDPSGDFSVIGTDTGMVTISSTYAQHYFSDPSSHFANFPIIAQQVDSLNDFAMKPLFPANDLCVTLSPIGFYRPGFPARYSLEYKNVGTTTTAPTIHFVHDPMLSFNSATVGPTTVNADTVTWQLPPVVPQQTGTIMIELTVSVNAVLSSMLTSTAHIRPLMGDADIHNNDAHWDVIVQGSYDPNDILVDKDHVQLQNLSTTPPDLTYIIRFQNTGTDTAFTVRIKNNVPTNADLSTFRFENSSHPLQVNYLHQFDRFEFLFENILLPDSNTNEPASHGFLRYSIKPQPTLLTGDSILNQAGIYFDFNAPIITNTAITIVDNATEILESEEIFISISPNPTQGKCLVQTAEFQENATIVIRNALGEVVIAEQFNGWRKVVDLHQQPKGMYNLEVGTDKYKFSKKLLLQ